MAHDLLSKFYSCLNLPLHEKLKELTKILDQSSPNKDLQTLFPQLISHIFGSPFTSGWGLRNITYELNKFDYEDLLQFLEPLGPMLRLCYKLLSDAQLKYELPLNTLPPDLQRTLERGRCPQFYADMLATDPQTMNVSALMLNPFDYYMFNFALHLVTTSTNNVSWENWNSVYFALACDYLRHFLPVDPNTPILPHIPNYTGKVLTAAPLQTANRPLYSPSLLLMSDLSGAVVSNQHPQTQSRNEVWRSETILQVFIDIWMSVDQFNGSRIDMLQRSMVAQSSSPERVRTVRVLVKHLHSFSAKHLSDPAVRSSSLRKYARQMMCSRGYHYVKHLVTTWPLDASFRLVMELWLSLIQPWRYVNNCISREMVPNNNHEENDSLDPISFTQFIAENFPTYTCIFQLVLPRFMRLDLTAHKTAIMLFRLGKVFSQPHLVPVLKDLEQAIMNSGSGLQHSPDNRLNNSGYEYNQSNSYNGLEMHKWVAVAKQAISEFNLTTNFEYEPIWSENVRQSATEFIKRILLAKADAENNCEVYAKRLKWQNRGLWSAITQWLMLEGDEEKTLLEESRKVPNYLNNSVHYFCNIFAIDDISLTTNEPIIEENSMQSSFFGNSSNLPLSITQKLRSKASVNYMGDPDLMPITTYENTILVRMFYQIASRINELYGPQFSNLWHRNDFWGYVAKEILEKPLRIQTYVKDITNYQNVVSEELAPRLSLRKLGSYAFVIWFAIGYVVFRLFSYSGLFYGFVLVTMWMLYVLARATFKFLKIM